MNWMGTALLLLILVLASPAFASPQLGGLGGLLKKKDKPQQTQQSDADKKKAEEDKKKKEEADKKLLFADDGGSSKQKKDTTAMGFSGLNPDGTVENAVLEASPSAEDQAAAAALGQTSLKPGELQAFLTEGSLRSKGGK
ncbi:MAG TPA: hypothetical protein VLA96_00545 [Terriglobales bacterium]|jgi:hypothetical protein|nr:hypothetical protein [Terriglobales bacterium]